MLKQTSKIIFFILFSIFSVTTYAVVDDANRLMNWAEQTFPDLFAPPSPTLTADPDWQYRVYEDTNTAVGVSGGKVFVTGGPFSTFGDIKEIGTLADLLVQGPDSNPSTNGGAGCVTPNLPQVGKSYKYNIQGQIAGEITIDYLQVSNTFVKTKTVTNFPSSPASSTDSIISQTLQREGNLIKTTLIETQANTSVGALTTKISYNPAYVISVIEFCQGASYANNDSTQTVETIIPGLPFGAGAITQASPKDTFTIAAVNESISVPAGTFNTVKVTSTNNSTVWTDINGGFLVKQITTGQDGSQTTELISAP